MSYSQTHIYKNFGVDEGLPSSEVYDMYQDKEGYMWFATDKGLSRFNGYEFKNFTKKNGLLDNTILDFFPQENGQIWCFGYHNKKLFYFNDVFDGFNSYPYNSLLNEKLPNVILKSVLIDDKNSLYVGGFRLSGYIEVTSEGKVTEKLNLNTINRNQKGNYVYKFGIKLNKRFFFGVNHHYKPEVNTRFIEIKKPLNSRFDITFLNNEHYIFINEKLGIISKDKNIQYQESKQSPIGIKRINDTCFFVGYYGNGAEIRDIQGNILDSFLPNKSVSSFLIDAEGGYWFSTLNDGVFYIKNPAIKVFTNEHISSLVKGNNNTLYAGYYNGNITRISNMKLKTLYHAFNNDRAYVEYDSVNNQLYTYSDLNLKNYTKEEIKHVDYTRKISEKIDSVLLKSGVNSFTRIEKDSIQFQIVNYEVQDACEYKDAIWIGTASGLIIHKDGITRAHQPKDILKSRIDDIDVNSNTNMAFMATQGSGMVVYGDSIYNITKAKGLTNNIISEVYIENDSTVWACSNSGLNRIVFKHNKTYNVTSITKENGLLSNDIDDIEVINDTVWVATKKGLCYFNKEILKDQKDLKILSLSLREIKVNNKNIYSKNVTLKYNQNDIDFKLQAISHKSSNDLNYLYRLKEVDSTWTTTKNRNINFPSLSPGDYTFEAKANVKNNQNDFLVSYAFKIRPPFWKSWWFYSVCFILCSGLVYLFFRIRILTYNQDIFRELLRLAVKRLKRKEQFYNFRSNGEDFKISSHNIQYIKSQGNYLDITTIEKNYTIRCKIGNFISTTPDPLEYLRVHRSYIIRIDQVSSKGKNWVVIKDQKIPVGETYLIELEKIQF